MRLHATPCRPCISRLYLNGLHTAPVVFEVYKVAPCGSMRLHAAPCISRLYLKDVYAAPVVIEVYTVAQCGSIQLHTSLDLV